MMWILVIVTVWLLIGSVTGVCIVVGIRRVEAEQAATKQAATKQVAAELASKIVDAMPLQKEAA